MKTFDFYGFMAWLISRQQQYEERAKVEGTERLVKLVHETCALALHEVQREAERFIGESDDRAIREFQFPGSHP